MMESELPNGLSRSIRWFMGELLVIVVGVLIAVSINSGYERGKAAAEQKRSFRQLVLDLKQTETAIEGALKVMRRSQAASAALLHEFNHPTGVSKDSLLRLTADAANLGGTPGLNLDIARKLAAESSRIADDSLSTGLQRVVEQGEWFGTTYPSTYQTYTSYGNTLRTKISSTERLWALWKRDSATAHRLYPLHLPFEPDKGVAFPLDPARFLADREAFTIVDGLFDSSSDATIILAVMLDRVTQLRTRTESYLSH